MTRIGGVGILTARGRGLQAVTAAIAAGWEPPRPRENASVPVYSVPTAALTDRGALSKARRADRFTRMAVLAAHDAVADAQLSPPEISSLGLIVATGFGPHQTTFDFLDGIIDYGEGAVSPTHFSHSVHNAAAYYVASALGCHGPTVTITRFLFSVHEALMLASAWLLEGRCRRILVGAVDTCGTVLEYVSARKLRLSQDGRMRPFAFSESPEAVPGEGAAFFVISAEISASDYATVEEVVIGGSSQKTDHADLYVIDADGLGGDERGYSTVAPSGVPVAAYSPLIGSSMTGTAFSVAISALMLRNQVLFRIPDPDAPGGANTQAMPLRQIECVRLDCRGSRGTVRLGRST